MGRIFQLILVFCFFISCGEQNGKKEIFSTKEESNVLIQKLKQEKQAYLNALNISHDSAIITRLKLLESLDQLSGQDKKYAIQIYTRMAAEESRRQNTSFADSIFTLANSLVKKIKDPHEFCHIYLCQGNLFRNKSLLDSSIYYYRKTIAHSEKYKDTSILIAGLSNLATSLNILNSSCKCNFLIIYNIIIFFNWSQVI